MNRFTSNLFFFNENDGMHFLILCIISSTTIFVIFRTIKPYNLPPFPVILINYLFAFILGFLLNPLHFTPGSIIKMNWFPLSMLIGILFILMFFVIAHSSQKAGISVTSVAGKMSVVFPIVLSMIISASDVLSFIKFMGIVLALAGVTLTIIKPGNHNVDYRKIYLPVILFVGMGIVDSLVKLAQHCYVKDESTAIFSAVLFLNAFVTGILILIFRPGTMRWFKNIRIWLWGLLLGIANFGSVFFMVRALNYLNPSGNHIDSSVIFGINNIGIVSLSVLAGLLIFREKLRLVNWIGIGISGFAIILFSLS